MSSTRPIRSANDNGPLSPGQVRALKIAIVVMGIMILVALVAIVWRLLTLKPKPQSSAAATTIEQVAFAPEHRISLPQGAAVKSSSIQANLLSVHYTSPAGDGIIVLDLVSGKILTRILIGQ